MGGGGGDGSARERGVYTHTHTHKTLGRAALPVGGAFVGGGRVVGAEGKGTNEIRGTRRRRRWKGL